MTDPHPSDPGLLPTKAAMYTALQTNDPTYEGVFIVGVRTTGIACRPTCKAKQPKPENVEFFANLEQALLAGYRPCKRCRPLEPLHATPAWLRPLLEEIEGQSGQGRWRDSDLVGRGFDPVRVRRWFVERHGMTFHAFLRARRVGGALGCMQRNPKAVGGSNRELARHGRSDLLRAGLDAGFESASGFRDAFARLFGMPPGKARVSATRVFVDRIETPLGLMVGVATDDALWLLEFADRRMLETQIDRVKRRIGDAAFVPGTCPVLDQAGRELVEYFAGKRTQFDVAMRLDGTDFQSAVWQQLLRIPCGEVRTYAELARAIERPTAVRAVGRANGDNRFAILVPCHRVVGASGDLVGYGGKLWRKKWLLERERSS